MFGVCENPHDAFPAEFLGLLDPIFRNEGLETWF